MIYNIHVIDTDSARSVFSFQSETLPRIGEDIVFEDKIDGYTAVYTVKTVVHTICRYNEIEYGEIAEYVGVMSHTIMVSRAV